MPTDSSVQPTQSTLQETSRTAEPEAGSDDPADTSLKSDAHERKDNWVWSDDLTEYINDEVSGKSLMICAGLKPLCDYNVDIGDLREFAEADDADFNVTDATIIDEQEVRVHNQSGDVEREIDGAMFKDDPASCVYGRVVPAKEGYQDQYGGWAIKGDMFDLPFTDAAGFDTTVVDPPWLELPIEQRIAILKQAIRVTKPTGKIIFNATFAPESEENVRGYRLRFRQDRDFWGGSSLIAFYKRTAEDVAELFDAHEYESENRYPEDSRWWSESYNPNSLSLEHNTDPKLISGDYDQYCCPLCGCSQLGHLTYEDFETKSGDYDLYECLNCQFRVQKAEVEELATAIEKVADVSKDRYLKEVETMEYTPPSVERVLESPNSSLVSPDLPWV